MNKRDARKIAETITTQEIREMFDKAKENISDWTAVSSVNKGITKGAAWNILTKGFNVEHKPHILAATNMVWEFGDYLPDDLKPKKKIKQKSDAGLIHQAPVFD